MVTRRDFLRATTAGAVLTHVPGRVEAKDEPDHVAVAQTSPPGSLDGRVALNRTGRNVVENAQEHLVRRDKTLALVPGLAETWRRVSNTMWEFRLRKGVKFHNGDAFDATSVVYSIEKSKGALPILADLQVKDATTVTFVTHEPYAPLPYVLADVLYLVPTGHYEKSPTHPIGTGPFQLVEHKQGQMLELRRNESYYGDKPLVRRLSFHLIPEKASQITALAKNQVQITDGYADRDFGEQLKRSSLPLVQSPAPGVVFVGLNPQDPALKDPRVRIAMNMVIDRKRLVEKMDLSVRLLDFVVPPQAIAAPRDVPWYGYEPTRAAQLLKEAGFSGRVTLAASSELVSLAKQIAGEWEAARIPTEVIVFDSKVFFEKLRQRSLGSAYLIRRTTRLWDPDWVLHGYAHSAGIFSNYKNPEVDKLIDLGRRSAEPSQRSMVYGNIAERLKGDPPFVPLFQELYTYGVRGAIWKPRADGLILGNEIDPKGAP
jgi:peptide/nickel transport system substrate-binding protein